MPQIGGRLVVVETLVASLRKSLLLGSLPDLVLAEVARGARRRSYQRGQIICHQGDIGDSLHVIESGSVKVVVDAPAHGQAVLRVLGRGECFGELALIDGEPRSATIEALEPTETVSVRRADFMHLVHTDLAALDAVLGALATMIRRLSGEVAAIGALDLEGRVAKKILDLAELHGRAVGDGTEIEIPIVQEDLAAMVGSTRTSVNRVLRWYEGRGAIRRHGRRIVVIDAPRLRDRIT